MSGLITLPIDINPMTSIDRSYYLDRDVYLFTRDDITRILDFRGGQFFALDPIASRMLSLTLEKGFEATVTEITELYDAPEELIRGDLLELLDSLTRKKLLVMSPASESSTGINPLKTFSIALLKRLSSIARKLLNPQPDPKPYTVGLLLSLAWISFRVLGWSRSIALWQNWHTSAIAKPSNEIIQRIDRLVRETASGNLFLPMVCKERALVGYHLLRAFYGYPATLVIGINNYPFQIHAWVEYRDLIITDNVDHCRMFESVLRYS
jgi:hypothetical protein